MFKGTSSLKRFYFFSERRIIKTSERFRKKILCDKSMKADKYK